MTQVSGWNRTQLGIGGAICGLGVVLGAFGAHALESVILDWYEADLAARKLDSWQTGVRYQMVHGLAIIAIGLLPAARDSLALRWSPLFFLAGIIIFSGGLYGWVLLDLRPLVMVVPLGGVCMIIGWIAFVCGAITAGPTGHRAESQR